MEPRISRDAATSNVLAWSVHAANMQALAEEEAGTDADEPPEPHPTSFRRTSIRKSVDHQQSLLTRALQKESDEESSRPAPGLFASRRRRSMNSTISLASTAELTSDTGITSPARTNTPSPPPLELRLVRLDSSKFALPRQELVTPVAAIVEPQAKGDPIKKRSISFACMGKPMTKTPPTATTPTKEAAEALKIAAPAPRRPCIKFVCPLKPVAQHARPQRLQTPPPPSVIVEPAVSDEPGSPSTIRKPRSPSNGRVSPNKVSALHLAQSPTRTKCRKYLEASSNDLQCESSRFHEFASDEPQEDDWIRRDSVVAKAKLTINDTLLKENNIRRIGKEAEEEAEQEEEEEEAATAEDEDDEANEEANEELDQGHGDDFSGYGSDDDGSAGYHTDEDIGFADSGDEEDDADDGFWTPSRTIERPASAEAFARRPSMAESHSDSSAYSASHLRTMRRHRAKAQRIKIRPGTPELPDSTDFVCGTFDEDRPLEDAYLSCIAQKKREKLRVIPQDIDPSFPTSDPEDEEEELFNPVHHGSDDDEWLHGDMEDINHEQERGRKKSTGRISPKRFHSPPPKRLQSPAPKNRGRSPKHLNADSPRRMRSPIPVQRSWSPTASPVHGAHGHIHFKLLGSGLPTQTKSLPRAPALFPLTFKANKKGKATSSRPGHVRGAIDIVKGLEQKRQRRKEKFYQKYCNRARKGQIPDRRPAPGQGAERMRELGLLMAGKAGNGNYVLSV